MPTAIVTGAAQGIGRAIAQRLAHDGYDLCLNDMPASQALLEELEKQVQSLGRKTVIHCADVSDREAVDAMVAASVASLGPLHTMVANAGIVQVKPLLEQTPADLERMFRVNVFGVHHCYAAAATQMIKQGRPPGHPPNALGLGAVPLASSGVYKIIGAASIAGMKPFPLLSHYSASKFAVRGLTQGFAMEMAPHGITVNAYSPGIVGTKMWEEIDAAMGARSGLSAGETMRTYSERLVALGRTSVAEDVANLVHFLASPDSDYMTGQSMLTSDRQNLVVDGGIMYT